MIINIDSGDSYVPYVDNVYAYWQHLGKDYRSAHEIHINRSDLPHDRNVLITQDPEQLSPDRLSIYDVALYDNRMESFGVATTGLEQYIGIDKVRMLTASKLHHGHPLNSKNIWYPFYIFTKQGHAGTYFDSNFPHCYDLIDARKNTASKTHGMIFVNGQNRSWRNFLLETISDVIPDLPIHNALTDHIIATDDCGFESEADSKFRVWVNDLYRDRLVYEQRYIPAPDIIGPDGKFGESHPGLRLIEAYKQFRCVIYPETSWQNNGMQITEKTVKCFVTHCVPWPIGGLHLHAQLEEVGFHTAWQLLPVSLQVFDSVEDHQERHRQMALAIRWLFENQHVLRGPRVRDLTTENFYNWHCFPAAHQVMETLSDVITGEVNA